MMQFFKVVFIYTVVIACSSDAILLTEAPINGSFFDFIIVGSGSAGGIVAARLSEFTERNFTGNVLLLEAGGMPANPFSTPFFGQSGNPDSDWLYPVVSQRNASFAFPNNSFTLNAGKMVGGSSQINNMVYQRGNPNDFNLWANLTRDDKWNFTNILPYYKKTETYTGNMFKSEYRGNSGPVYVSQYEYDPPLLKEWLEAGQEIGFPLADPNGEHQRSSFYPNENTVRKGLRWETFEGFVEPCLRKNNFQVLTHAHVAKVILNDAHEAIGVTFVHNKTEIIVFIREEIILSAGTIGSPKILLLSGIGDPSHLSSVGITPVIDLKGVGRNLADHVISTVGPFLVNDTGVSFINERDLKLEHYEEYSTSRTGPLSWNKNSGAGVWSTEGRHDWPNVVLVQSAVRRSLGGVRPEVNEAYMRGLQDVDMIWVALWLGRPKSRGTVSLASNNPMDPPLIDPAYFSDPDDIKVLVEGFKFVINLVENTKSYQKYNATFTSTHFPGCEMFDLRTDQYYECYIRQFSSTVWHVTSSCKMGAADDPMAVVDSDLRVRGVKNLRVIDASVMPTPTNTNTNGPTMMLAEVGSDLILKQYQTKETSGCEIQSVKTKLMVLLLFLLIVVIDY